jgi:hypothetical protein
LNAGNQLFTAESRRSIARENAGKSTTLKSDGKPDDTIDALPITPEGALPTTSEPKTDA